MRVRGCVPIVGMIAALGLLPGTAAAQAFPTSEGIGLKVVGGLHALSGDDFGEAPLDLQNGFGAEAVVSAAFPSGWEVGLGVGIGFHDPEALGTDPSGDVVTVFAEPIYRFRPAVTRIPHVHPFLGARLGWARLNLDSGDGEEPAANGLQAGGIGGVELWVSDEVGLVGSASYDFLSFGELDEVLGDGPSGGRLALQGGLKVRFP